MTPPRARFVVAALLVLGAHAAAADPLNISITGAISPAVAASTAPTIQDVTGASHLATPSHVVTDGGSDLRLPPGYFLPEPAWSKLDVELRRLQDSETGLQAANSSLRQSMSGWTPGWKTLAVALVTGIALGVYADRKL